MPRELLALLAVVLLGACSGRSDDPIEQGRRVYVANCIACHNADPTQDGVMGPAVAGAPLELLEARVLRGAYPDGYTPRRETALMVALPYLQGEIPALAAYLASVAPAGGAPR